MKQLYPIFALVFATSYAQAEAISADRPGYTSGTHTVAPGHFHIEAGMTRSTSNQGASVTSISIPQTNVRIGMLDRLELDIQWAGMSYPSPGNSSTGDMTVGGKYGLMSEADHHLSLLGLLTFNTGTPTPLLGLLWDYTLQDGHSLFGTVQTIAKKSGSWQSNLQAAIGTSHGINEHLSAFAEVFVDTPINHTGSTTTMLDGGLSYLYDDDLQLDLSIGFSLARKADDFIGMGFARRF